MKRVMIASALVTGAAFVLPVLAQDAYDSSASPSDTMMDDGDTSVEGTMEGEAGSTPGLPDTGRGL